MLVIALGTVFKIGIFIYIYQPRGVKWKHSSHGNHMHVGLLFSKLLYANVHDPKVDYTHKP